MDITKLQEELDKKQIVEINNATMKLLESYSKNSMYFLDELLPEDDDYGLIKKCFVDKMQKPCSKSRSIKVSELKIYRVIHRENNEKDKQQSDNLLLYHGTDFDSTVGILDKGFKPSISGLYGPGVYLTERSLCATLFSVRKNGENEAYNKWKENLKFGNKTEFKFKKENFIFVNEILESKELKNKTVSKQNSSLKTSLKRKRRFEKYTLKTNFRTDFVETFESDSRCRKIKVCNGSRKAELDYYVCDEKLAIPRYLIQFSLTISYNGE